MGKYILGVNGWPDRSHDASACIVKDGRILVMAEEERFIRKKHAYDKLPINATAWCLKKLNLTVDDIDVLAVGWDYPKLYSKANLRPPNQQKIIESYLPKTHFTYRKSPKLITVQHHLAHAASAYYLSGMDEAAIIVADGGGEAESTSFWYAQGAGIKQLERFPMSSSLGYFYEAISEQIGLERNGAGKTMGLAPYGKTRYSFENVTLTSKGYTVELPKVGGFEGQLDEQLKTIAAWHEFLDAKPHKVRYSFDLLRNRFKKTVTMSQNDKDLAASAQATLESILIHCSNILVKKTGTKNLCFAGGVALNCSTNSKILQQTSVDSLFIPPFPHDGGVAAGAALYAGRTVAQTSLETSYMGPTFTNSQIERVLKTGVHSYKKTNSIEEDVAQLLYGGKIVGWFMGAMEVGPRALGNRSILASPETKSMRNRVNRAKDREQWRPFAPSVALESVSDFFIETHESPFMLHTYNVKEDQRSKIKAVVHIDGTTRAQTVTAKSNPRYYKLIKAFESLSGIPMVLNTSFNGADEPIVCSPEDALRTFATHDIDALAIGDYLVLK